MNRFKNILVGLDLSQGHTLVADQRVSPTETAVEHAIWLAEATSAQLHFLYVPPASVTQLDAETQILLEGHHGRRTVVDHAKEVVARMAQDAYHAGVVAHGSVACGKSWVDIIRQVLRDDHDLVIVGTRSFSAAKQFVIGSTGITLLRTCPCPVWVTTPSSELSSILVAHDLRPVGDLAMSLGCSMAKRKDAQLHVLHVADYPAFHYMLPASIPPENPAAYRTNAESHIKAQLADASLGSSAKVHFASHPPADRHMLDCIDTHNINLLVMGTLGRAGVSAFITGNPAERLLPQIPCSILAVKPTGFKTPVTLDEEPS